MKVIDINECLRNITKAGCGVPGHTHGEPVSEVVVGRLNNPASREAARVAFKANKAIETAAKEVELALNKLRVAQQESHLAEGKMWEAVEEEMPHLRASDRHLAVNADTFDVFEVKYKEDIEVEEQADGKLN